MRLIDLSPVALRAIGFALYMIALAALFCASRAFRLPAGKGVFACSLIAGLVNFMLSAAVAIVLIRMKNNQPFAPLTQRILALPVPGVGLFAAVSLAASIVLLIRLRRLLREELSTLSVCEGLDLLPDGICVSLPDGLPRLVNSSMQQIANAAFGAGVQDARWFDEKLEHRDLTPGCSVETDDGNSFLLLADGTVRQLQRKTISVDGKPMTELIAYDVTERYRALQELRARNARLKKTNRHLRTYLESIDRAVREKEILTAKIRLHNRLGQCLLAIHSFLGGTDGSRAAITEQLRQTVALLQSDAPSAPAQDRLHAVRKAAGAIGVEIRITGEIPPEYKLLFEVALHECLTNTFKHAHGHLLEAEITQTAETVTIKLTNDGDPPAGPVEETGGLRNLRTAVEHLGGIMEIESTPAFVLTLRFCRKAPGTGDQSWEEPSK